MERTKTLRLATRPSGVLAMMLRCLPCTCSWSMNPSQNRGWPPTTRPTSHSPESICSVVRSECTRSLGTNMYSPSSDAAGSVYTTLPLSETVATTRCVIASHAGSPQYLVSIGSL